MNLSAIYTAKAVALNQTEAASNKIADLGEGFFPRDKKMGLDLKWIKTHKGLAVSLAPSTFDAKSKIRTRKGFKFDQQKMAFFRESMTVSEEDQQEILRVQESSDPYAQEVLKHIYSDVDTLVSGARVVPERMRMQLLFPTSGGPSIYISDGDVDYSYNYDGDGTWALSNRKDLSGTFQWSNPTTAKPLSDIKDVKRALSKKGSIPKYMLMNQTTFDMMLESEQIKSAILAQNSTANIFLDDPMLKTFIAAKCSLTILVYNKIVKDESAADIQLVPDGFVAFLPEGTLGKTWFGTTPEERTLMGNANAEVSIIDNGITVTVITTAAIPVETETTVSMIVLPSFERMDEVYLLGVGVPTEVNAELDFLTATSVAGTATGTTVFAVTEALGAGNSYKVKAVATGATLPNYGTSLRTWAAYVEGADFVTTTGYEVVIAEVDSDYKAVAAVVIKAVCKA